MLEFITKNRTTFDFEKVGLLMPRKLTRVNLKKAYDLLRISYLQDKELQKACSLSVLLQELAKRVQRARYEEYIIRLASAYANTYFFG